MRRLTVTLIALIISIGGIALTGSAASADGGYCDLYPDSAYCTVTVPGGGGGGGGGDDDDDDQGGSVGGGGCFHQGAQVPCSLGGAWWSTEYECYIGLSDPQLPPPAGKEGEPGAWYDCALPDAGIGYTYGIWLATAPTISPADAAAAVAARLRIDAIAIGMAPQVSPTEGYRRTHVGVPVWLWVANRSATSYDGYTVNDAQAGMPVTGTVRVTSIVWNMGDGSNVTCGNAGTEYSASAGWATSPSCGYVYSRTSSDAGFPITATSNWTFFWSAGGQNGQIPLTVSTTSNVRVNELQTVNTSPNG